MRKINFTNESTKALVMIYVLDGRVKLERVSDWSGSKGANWYFEPETLGM